MITELELGGAERCLANLGGGLDRERFSPRVYSLAPRPAAGRDQLVRQLEAADVPVEFLDVASKFQFWTAVRRMTVALREHPPDLLQAFLFHANIVGTIAARRANVRCVVTGVRVADPSRCRLWTERAFSGRVDRIVCVSESVAEHCRRAGYPGGRLHAIPNGIEIEAYRSTRPLPLDELRVGANRGVILFVGRLDEQKGVDWLLAASPRLLERLPGHDLVLVGDGPERARLERQAEAAGIAERVHFVGRRDDVPRILRAAKVLVLPSRWEGMPNVILEAMATGIPVVATRVEGVVELLGADLARDQTVDHGDSDALVDCVTRICSEETIARQLGRRNEQRAAQSFSLRRMIEAYESLYVALLPS